MDWTVFGSLKLLNIPVVRLAPVLPCSQPVQCLPDTDTNITMMPLIKRDVRRLILTVSTLTFSPGSPGSPGSPTFPGGPFSCIDDRENKYLTAMYAMMQGSIFDMSYVSKVSHLLTNFSQQSHCSWWPHRSLKNKTSISNISNFT